MNEDRRELDGDAVRRARDKEAIRKVALSSLSLRDIERYIEAIGMRLVRAEERESDE